VLHDITLTADSSKRLGVVGASGSGKSTLSRQLAGLSAPTQGTVVNGTPWRSVRRRDVLRRQVQMIQQDPYAQLTPHLTARSAIAEAVQVGRACAGPMPQP
jgi:peptide/nickel transport system ATP-binding protein